MSKRMTALLATAGLGLSLPAYADCAERVTALETHPALADSATPADGSLGGSSSEKVAGGTESVQEHGGETEHAEGGPATPSESWFTDARKQDASAALAHLDAAKKARDGGDEQACLRAIEQAEAALRQ